MPKESVGRIATLDGLRAVSIVLVLFSHLTGTVNFLRLAHTAWLAEAGVRTFFVISGFLITTLLVRERDKTGRISLRDFYVRRAFRIFPAFYTYIAVIAVLVMAGVLVISKVDFAYAVSYAMNFHEHRAWYLGHMWSLAVEEQFYVLWPLLMVVLGTRRALMFAIGAVLLAPVLRVGALVAWPAISGLTDQAFPFVFDSIALGCVLAILRSRLEAWPPYRRLLTARWFWLVPLALIPTLIIERPVIDLGFSTTAANVGIALAIHRCVMMPTARVGRVLELPGFVWIGTLSYSLYLWQQPFLDRHDTGWWAAFPINLGLALALACVSFYLIEKPWLRLGRRFRR
ncbi:MAG: acyltransferase [Kofleriaceae bacterium]